MTYGQIKAELQEWKKIPAEALSEEAYKRMYDLQAVLDEMEQGIEGMKLLTSFHYEALPKVETMTHGQITAELNVWLQWLPTELGEEANKRIQELQAALLHLTSRG